MSTAYQDVKILTVASCSFVRQEHRSHVVVSGSYGGRYNAFNAAKWGVRGVIMNDAGIGKDNAGIRGLDYLDQINLAAATADAQTCHIGDGDHMLEHGIISQVNRAATALGCSPGQSVRECAELMRSAIVPATAPPSIIASGSLIGSWLRTIRKSSTSGATSMHSRLTWHNRTASISDLPCKSSPLHPLPPSTAASAAR